MKRTQTLVSPGILKQVLRVEKVIFIRILDLMSNLIEAHCQEKK